MHQWCAPQWVLGTEGENLMKNILVVILLLACAPGHAELIDNSTFFTDTDSGLDWLKMAPTLNRSYNDVSSKLGAGQEFDGWRYASGSEFEQLLLNGGATQDSALDYMTSGVSPAPCATGVIFCQNDRELAVNGSLVPIAAVSDLLGNLAPIPPLIQLALTQGLISDVDIDNVDPTARFLAIIYLSPNVGAFVDTFTGSLAPGDTNSATGSYLVRASTIPIPAAVWLLGSALGLLGWMRRKKT